MEWIKRAGREKEELERDHQRNTWAAFGIGI
jgi:hypothetical protein